MRRFKKITKGMTAGDAEASMREAFEPTPNLAEKVNEILDKAIAAGFILKPGVYREPEGGVCALGAISIGLDPVKDTEKKYDRKDVFALSKRALGCNPLELDSIEAGFECWDWNDMLREGYLSEQSLTFLIYDEVAYNIGKRIRLDRVGDLHEEDYKHKTQSAFKHYVYFSGEHYALEELRASCPSAFDAESFAKDDDDGCPA